MTNNQILKKLSQDMRMRNFSHYTYDSYMRKTKEMMEKNPRLPENQATGITVGFIPGLKRWCPEEFWDDEF